MEPRIDSLSVSWKDVARHDVLGHILAWMLGLVLTSVPAALIYSLVTGWQPSEPWSEIGVGVGAMALVGYALLRWRAARVARFLGEARQVEARVEKYLPAGMWSAFTVTYEIDGEERKARITVPNTKRSTRLGRASRVTLAVAPQERAVPIVLDLYREGRFDSESPMP